MTATFRLLPLLSLVLIAGCLGGGSPEGHGGAGDVTVRVVNWEPPVAPQPISDRGLEDVPELERMLVRAEQNANGTAYREIGPSVANRFEDVFADPPTYPGENQFRPNGSYIQYNGSIVLIQHRRPGPETLVRAYPDAGEAPVNENVTSQLRNVTALHRLVQKAVRRDEPVTEVLGEGSDAAVERFLDELDAHRPVYNARDNWGVYVRYRHRTYVIRMKRNSTAA